MLIRPPIMLFAPWPSSHETVRRVFLRATDSAEENPPQPNSSTTVSKWYDFQKSRRKTTAWIAERIGCKLGFPAGFLDGFKATQCEGRKAK